MVITVRQYLEMRKELATIDVRAPVEYENGHIPTAINIPILNNDERAAVGTAYQQHGRQDAIMTGFKLIGPNLHDIIQQASSAANGQDILVHCWRGGMRSSFFAKFVEMAGMKAHTLTGGYKAYRNDGIAYFKKPWNILRLGGCTGTGKSELLRSIKSQGEQVLDLESLAQHKGSVFGGLNLPPQPTTEQFQNILFETLRNFDPTQRIWVEDESILIGNIVIPTEFWKQMTAAPLVEIKMEKTLRIQRLVNEYGNTDSQLFLGAMEKIVKRLGGQHYKAAREYWLSGKKDACIDALLTYYDKAYEKGLQKKDNKIIGCVTWNGQSIKKTCNDILQLPKQIK